MPTSITIIMPNQRVDDKGRYDQLSRHGVSGVKFVTTASEIPDALAESTDALVMLGHGYKCWDVECNASEGCTHWGLTNGRETLLNWSEYGGPIGTKLLVFGSCFAFWPARQAWSSRMSSDRHVVHPTHDFELGAKKELIWFKEIMKVLDLFIAYTAPSSGLSATELAGIWAGCMVKARGEVHGIEYAQDLRMTIHPPADPLPIR